MLLHNRYFLYFIFLIALLDFLYLGYVNDIHSVSVFVLVGLLTAFFSKNMIVVLSTTLIVTNILRVSGYNDILFDEKEGLTNKDANHDTAEDTDEEDEDDSDETVIKEDFGQDKEVVYTSVEDQKISDQEKIFSAHETLLKKMNKYKPLLDTLSGLTKNIAAVKQITQTEKPISDDNTAEYKKEMADIKSRGLRAPKETKAPKETRTPKETKSAE